MIPTIDFIAERFDFFNKLCFCSKLPTPKFAISNAKSYAGQLKFRKNPITGKAVSHKGDDFKITLSRRFDLPQEVVEDTLLHEMIHLFIESGGRTDTAPHGRRFTAMMDDLNHRFRRHISVRVRQTESSSEGAVPDSRLHIICLMRLEEGRNVLAIPARTRIYQFMDMVERLARVKAHIWLASYNPFFNKFPRSLKGKTYYITPEEIRKELADAFPVKRSELGLHIIKQFHPSPDFGGCID